MIKISKEDKSQKLFISLGTFVKDYLDNEVFKVFQKQQLIDSSAVKNRAYFEEDVCELRIDLVDSGEDRIIVKVYGKIEHTNSII